MLCSTAAIAAALGVTGVGSAYDIANTTPNIVYELLLGGILTSIVVPLLVRAAKDGDAAGERGRTGLDAVLQLRRQVTDLLGRPLAGAEDRGRGGRLRGGGLLLVLGLG